MLSGEGLGKEELPETGGWREREWKKKNARRGGVKISLGVFCLTVCHVASHRVLHAYVNIRSSILNVAQVVFLFGQIRKASENPF